VSARQTRIARSGRFKLQLTGNSKLEKLLYSQPLTGAACNDACLQAHASSDMIKLYRYCQLALQSLLDLFRCDGLVLARKIVVFCQEEHAMTLLHSHAAGQVSLPWGESTMQLH
jgi:hypothetical protein